MSGCAPQDKVSKCASNSHVCGVCVCVGGFLVTLQNKVEVKPTSLFLLAYIKTKAQSILMSYRTCSSSCGHLFSVDLINFIQCLNLTMKWVFSIHNISILEACYLCFDASEIADYSLPVTHTHTHPKPETRAAEQRLIIFSITFHWLRQGISLNLHFVDSANLTSLASYGHVSASQVLGLQEVAILAQIFMWLLKLLQQADYAVISLALL